MSLNNQFSVLLGKSLDVLKRNQLVKLSIEGQESEEIGDRYYITNKMEGIGFVFDELKNLVAIHFHSARNGYNKYTGVVPCEFDFEDSIDRVHQKIGLENFDSGGGEILPILGPSNPWRKYKHSNQYLPVEFNKKGKILVITLGLMR